MLHNVIYFFFKFKVTLQISLQNQETDSLSISVALKVIFSQFKWFKILFSKKFKTPWRRKL